MNKRNIFLVLVVIVLALAAGTYFRAHPLNPAFAYTIIETGDRQHREDTQYYTIQVNYPDKTPLATRGKSGAEAKAESTITDTVKDLINQFKQAGGVDNLPQAEKDRLTAANLKYALSVDTHAFSSGSFVSYEFDVFMDTGGAHPENSYKTLVFDMNGNTVKLGDLFTPNSDYLNRISQAATTQVKAQLEKGGGAGAGDTIIADGVAPQEENFSNFVVDSGELRIFIPPYQAAAYAAGPFEVDILLSDLKDILKPGIN